MTALCRKSSEEKGIRNNTQKTLPWVILSVCVGN